MHDRSLRRRPPPPTPPHKGEGSRSSAWLEQQHEGREKEDVGGGIGKAARRPLDVLHQARAEEQAEGNRGEDKCQSPRPGQRQETPEQSKHKERQKQKQRE